MLSVLMSLDCLLDTRLGTVLGMSKEAYDILLKTNYFDRNTDDFEAATGGVITNEEFQKAYAARDVETLQISQTTNMPVHLSEIACNIKLDPEIMEFNRQTKLMVNTHPYELDSEELEVLLDILGGLLPNWDEISIGSIPLNMLTPEYLEDNWNYVYVYNFNEWLVMYGPQLEHKRIPLVTFVTPRVLQNGVPKTEEEIKNLQAFDVFMSGEFLLHEYVGLRTIPTHYFSRVSKLPETA
ncbi:MAG: hypothetical protein ACMV0F_06530 [Trichlorobacter sp.]